MHRRTARGNRLGLVVVGVVLLAGAVALFGARLGWYGRPGRHARVYPGSAATFVRDNSDWLWPVAAAVAIVLGLVFLRWLLVQPRTDTVRRVVLDTDGDDDPGPAARCSPPAPSPLRWRTTWPAYAACAAPTRR